MGFGILFIGYLLLFNTVARAGLTKFFSYLVILYALTKLGRYNRDLKRAFKSSVTLAVFGLGYFLCEALSMFDMLSPATETSLFRFLPFLAALLELILHFFLLRGLQAMAKETAVPMLEVKAFRNRIYSTVYYVLYLIARLEVYPESAQPVLFYASLILLLVGIIVMFLNAKLIFGFYMWICLPEDLEMQRKSTNIPVLDRMGRWLDDMEERRLQKRRETDAAYQDEKRLKKEAKKKK